ncbi:substrate-binding domain-containing protein [Kitasatospora sp. NBC_00240]|uniref:substrate-binding domain-containing protein n=1 Tax=Kitasatospora sp. NBC_00240 TaxID=2903567 RepID=UPI00224CA614|nr:substrate-binding domain-containing protein [Kitasatospora sp. NBC_00240]MCX5208389.1 substrate-binding domain-containing protein [Kitasatospora sp. NBC_00240]
MTSPALGHSLRTAGLITLALAVTGCALVSSPHDAAGPTGRLSLTYLQKQADQPYFMDEAAGARAKAAELGVDLDVINLGNRGDTTRSELQKAIERKTNGLIAVLPDPAEGPDFARTAKEAGIPLLTSDDQICTNYPDPGACFPNDLVPRVGFSGTGMGKEVGTRAAAEFARTGWNSADTRILSVYGHDIPVCGERVHGALDAFHGKVPGSTKDLEIWTDNTAANARLKVALAVTANAGVKHWVVWGCNDENVQGAAQALRDAGFGPDNVIGIGIGAGLACREWLTGKPSAMRAALYIKGKDVGALAVEKLVTHIRRKQALPAETLAPTTMVDPTNWQASGLSCT